MKSSRCLGLKKSGKSSIFKCRASYYNPVTQRWQEGEFILQRSHLEFVTENSDEETKNPFHLCLPLATISSVEKRMSSFLFAALLIRVGTEKHWFASFPNRDAVYNNLELFWKDSLLGKQFSIKPTANEVDPSLSSPLGKELLGVLCDSEKHLVDAAYALEEQSKQLQEAEGMMSDMNGDLSVVEKQLNILNSLSGLPFSSESVEETTKVKEKKTELRKHKYSVTFSAVKVTDSYNEWEKGTLVIAGDITVLDDKENLKFLFPAAELKTLKVVSPWELHIVKEDESLCYIMCPMLSRVLRIFGTIPFIKDKVVYSDDESDLTASSSSCSSNQSVASTSSAPSSPNVSFNLPDLPKLCEQVEKVRDCGYLTDEEIQAISSKLTDLHDLATEVEKEKQSQMERINLLINDVEKVDVRLNQDTKKLRKLT